MCLKQERTTGGQDCESLINLTVKILPQVIGLRDYFYFKFLTGRKVVVRCYDPIIMEVCLRVRTSLTGLYCFWINKKCLS